MKWFKHFSGSRRDPDLSLAREKFGGAGVDIFWSTLELLAEEFKGNGSFTASKAYFTSNIPGYSFRKILKVWQYFGETSREKRRIIVQIEGDMVTVTVPKFYELADEYWRKLLNKSGATPAYRSRSRSKDKEKTLKTLMGSPSSAPPGPSGLEGQEPAAPPSKDESKEVLARLGKYLENSEFEKKIGKLPEKLQDSEHARKVRAQAAAVLEEGRPPAVNLGILKAGRRIR